MAKPKVVKLVATIRYEIEEFAFEGAKYETRELRSLLKRDNVFANASVTVRRQPARRAKR